jgi:hypothetical protein
MSGHRRAEGSHSVHVRAPSTIRATAFVAAMFIVAAGCGSQPPPPVSAAPMVSTPAAVAPTSAAPTPQTSPADEGMSWMDVACPYTGGEFDGEIHQQMDGAVSTCMQVGAVASGSYTVALEQPLTTQGSVDVPGSAPASGAPLTSVQLSLSPDAGMPGTTVTVSGTLTAPIPQRQDVGNLCWDGCPGGLEYEGVNLHWTSATTFQTTMVVPAAPWLEADPARVGRLVSGSYLIGIKCLNEVHGCALLGSQGTATFHLQVPAADAPTWCATQESCARLSVSPGAALPGAVVNVNGFAPLAEIIGSDQPWAYQLQTRAGDPSRSSVNFNAPNSKDAVFAELGQGALTVLPAPTFASLKNTNAVAGISDGFPAVVGDPADPTVHAWCDRNTVVVASASGARTVSTATATATLKRLGFPPYDDANPGCDAVAFADAAKTGSQALAVAFGVTPPDQEPLYGDVALTTLDNGRTWTPVPAPPGARAIDFGGFRRQDAGLLAVFSPGNPSAADAPPLAEISRDGAHTWQSTRLGCPAAGPCVTFGPFQPGNCAKGQATQTVVSSADAGQTWSEPLSPAWIGACAPAQLAAMGDGGELLVDNMSEFTLRRSTDGGATWADIAVPLLPEQQPGGAVGIGTDGITLLSDGALLATGQEDSNNDWLLLRPGADAWCQITTPGTGTEGTATSTVVVLGTAVWWLTYDQNGAATAHDTDIVALSC